MRASSARSWLGCEGPRKQRCGCLQRSTDQRISVPEIHLRLAELAAETGWSDRHLRAKFQAETGLAPKAAARVIRFDRARRMLQRRALAGDPFRLAELAASCGYFDQAHLDREFGLLAGCPPTTWVMQEFRNFQVSAGQPLPA